MDFGGIRRNSLTIVYTAMDLHSFWVGSIPATELACRVATALRWTR